MLKSLIVLALFVTPAVAAGQSVNLAGATRSASTSAPERPRLSPQAQARIDARISAAVHRGVPAAPLRRRAAEGQAKLASERLILSALERLEANLQVSKRAFAALGRTPSDAEVAAGGEALAQGASEAQLARIIGSAPDDRSVEVALTTLAVLASRGEAVPEAVLVIESQLAANDSDRSIAALVGGEVRRQ